jgi:TP901-1 family phage major tail protein
MPNSAYMKGLEMLLKIDTSTSGAPVYTSVAGMQSKGINFDQELVDVTNQDSPGRWRELLFGVGVRKVSFSADGNFTNSAAGTAVMQAFLAGTPKMWQVIVPGMGTFTGLFAITKFDFKGPHDKELSFSFHLESAGEVVMTA